ncbi:hypothetical protein PSQ39_14130 [Curvibacter sp. HBC28]|jgi:hypothetical protein|uniref:Two pore domain potassium channel family protein n=1 Tax=Curvibacter microcysteis TaxID=3026419 RepID=A0ABT5MGR6_9BURK|nr:hypothetical protein [Curvibacter sp. HBC28]MDD0815772.1 hypothetical protein [Curvibacter sp. HBC28]
MASTHWPVNLIPHGLSPTQEGYLMFLYAFGFMVLVIATHGFLLLSLVLRLFKNKKLLNLQHPFRLKLMFVLVIMLILFLHFIEIQSWALFVWMSHYYRGFLSSVYFAGLAYSTLGLYGETRYEQWQQALPLMIAFSGMFCTGLSGSMLFTLLMSALQGSRQVASDASAEV